MAEALSVENSERQLSCSICQETYKDVIVSSCFHTFCRNCLKGHLQNSMKKLMHYECPICKTRINVPLSLTQDLNLGPIGSWDRHSNQDADGHAYYSSTCDICSNGKMAVNRCLQCEENFCESCTNAHLKMKASRYHGQRVVSLRGQGHTDGLESLDKSRMFCPRHRNEEIIVVCKQCDIFLCLVCKLLEHENHVTKLVSEEASSVRKNLSTLLQRQTGYSENLQMRIQMMNNKKSQYPRDLDQELAKVRHQASKMHFEIEKEKTDTEQELVQHYNGYLHRNSEAYGDAKQDYDEYVSMSTEAQHLLDSDNDVNIVLKGGRLYEKLHRMETSSEISHTQENEKPFKKFVPGEIYQREMQKMVGHLSHSEQESFRSNSSSPRAKSDRAKSDYLTITHVSSFILPSADGVGYVYGIAPVDGQQAWITMLDHRHVTLVNARGNTINKVDIGELCDGVAADGKRGCFVTCPGNKSIKHVANNSEVSTVVSELTQEPHGIATLKYLDAQQNALVEEMFVCFTDTRSLTSSMFETQKYPGVVTVFSLSGQDLGRSFLVQAPVRIDTHPETEMVCVSDHTNGCVTVCDKSGQMVTALYTGVDGHEDELFKPLGVCFDKFGYVIIADWKGGKVSRISQEGTWMQDLVNNLDGPQSVAIGDDGLLWIGGKHGNVHVYRIY